MRNLFKKGLSAAIALSMAASMAVIVPITASAYMLEEGVLTPTKEEVEASYAIGTNNPPWYDNAESITSVVLPADATSIGNSAFTGLTALTSIDLSGTQIKRIQARAFRNDRSLASVTWPESLDYIGSRAFEACGFTTLSLSCNNIDESAFRNMSQLTSVTLLSGTSYVGANAFEAAPLTSLSLPEGLTKIGESAFQEANMTSMTIPSTVTGDNKGVYGNPALKTINYTAKNAGALSAEEDGEVGATAFTAYMYAAHDGEHNYGVQSSPTWTVISNGETKTFANSDAVDDTAITLTGNGCVQYCLIVKHLCDPNATATVTVIAN